MSAPPALTPDQIRVKALVRFAVSITFLNIIGRLLLGFETSFLQWFVTIAVTYSCELILQAVDDRSHGRRPVFLDMDFKAFVIFLLPAHITGSAISMLLFAHDELLPYVLAGVGAITSKAIFTVNVNGRPRHFLNPSNMGLVASILIYERIGLAAPYQFSEHLSGALYVLLPLFILTTGSLLNGKLTRKMHLVYAWVGTFIAQAVVRHLLFDTYLPASLVPITGVAFVIFTFYMITDPATSPPGKRGQIVFGVSLGVIYGLLMVFHQPFTLIVALLILCVIRGGVLYAFERGWMPKVKAWVDHRPVPQRAGPVPAGPQPVTGPVAVATVQAPAQGGGAVVQPAMAGGGAGVAMAQPMAAAHGAD